MYNLIEVLFVWIVLCLVCSQTANKWPQEQAQSDPQQVVQRERQTNTFKQLQNQQMASSWQPFSKAVATLLPKLYWIYFQLYNC